MMFLYYLSVGYIITIISVHIFLAVLVLCNNFEITYKTDDVKIDRTIEALNADPVKASVVLSVFWLAWIISYIFD
ncbi:hypothetical protein [Dolichospermum phage Dfl-JY23]